jgi:hypothetical protein
MTAPSRNIRAASAIVYSFVKIWVAKYEAGGLDSDTAAADVTTPTAKQRDGLWLVSISAELPDQAAPLKHIRRTRVPSNCARPTPPGGRPQEGAGGSALRRGQHCAALR